MQYLYLPEHCPRFSAWYKTDPYKLSVLHNAIRSKMFHIVNQFLCRCELHQS